MLSVYSVIDPVDQPSAELQGVAAARLDKAQDTTACMHHCTGHTQMSPPRLIVLTLATNFMSNLLPLPAVNVHTAAGRHNKPRRGSLFLGPRPAASAVKHMAGPSRSEFSPVQVQQQQVLGTKTKAALDPGLDQTVRAKCHINEIHVPSTQCCESSTHKQWNIRSRPN